MGAPPTSRRAATTGPGGGRATTLGDASGSRIVRAPLPIPKPTLKPEPRRDSSARLPAPTERVKPRPRLGDDDAVESTASDARDPRRAVAARSPTADKDEPQPKLFRWTDLPKVTRQEASLLKSVEWAFPAEPGKAMSALTARFKELFETDAQITFHHFYLATPDQLGRQIPQPACMQQLALAPHLPRGLFEVELALAHAVVDQLLGGAAGESVMLRPLTDIEEGVLGYVIVEGLRSLAQSVDPKRPRIRLEGAVATIEEAQALLSLERTLVVLQFTLALGEAASGYFRLFLPATALRGLEPPSESDARRVRRAARIASHGDRLEAVEGPAWVEIGHCELTTGELTGLASGDVMLVEDLSARPDKGEGGRGRLKVGVGQHGAWDVELAFDAEQGLQATLGELHLGRPTHRPRDAAPPTDEPSAAETAESDVPTGEHAPLPDERQAEMTEPPGASPWDEPEHTTVNQTGKTVTPEAPELLNDIPLHVAVELGRLTLSADEVVALRSGQVLRMGKGPQDGVDLSVNGKIVAHGELVEIDGQLGVRITALV